MATRNPTPNKPIKETVKDVEKTPESIDTRKPAQPVVRTNDGTHEEDIEEQAP